MTKNPTADIVLDRLRCSRKYGHLCPDMLRRIAAFAVGNSRSTDDAIKKAKRRLHQIYGAFSGSVRTREIEALLAGITRASSEGAIRQSCRTILAMHSSTRERLPILEDLYSYLFSITGVPGRIIDLGCGLHPFSIPWMNLPEGCHYVAIDIDSRWMELIASLLERLELRGRALCSDILIESLGEPCDVVFMLKLLPTIERQESEAAMSLLETLPARFAVVSFPTTTLGKRSRGMLGNYRDWMDEHLTARSLPARSHVFASELFYVIDLRHQLVNERRRACDQSSRTPRLHDPDESAHARRTPARGCVPRPWARPDARSR